MKDIIMLTLNLGSTTNKMKYSTIWTDLHIRSLVDGQDECYLAGILISWNAVDMFIPQEDKQDYHVRFESEALAMEAKLRYF